MCLDFFFFFTCSYLGSECFLTGPLSSPSFLFTTSTFGFELDYSNSAPFIKLLVYPISIQQQQCIQGPKSCNPEKVHAYAACTHHCAHIPNSKEGRILHVRVLYSLRNQICTNYIYVHYALLKTRSIQYIAIVLFSGKKSSVCRYVSTWYSSSSDRYQHAIRSQQQALPICKGKTCACVDRACMYLNQDLKQNVVKCTYRVTLISIYSTSCQLQTGHRWKYFHCHEQLFFLLLALYCSLNTTPSFLDLLHALKSYTVHTHAQVLIKLF